MHSSHRTSDTMTEHYYKKSENARHLSRTALLWLDQWRRLVGSPIGTETADKLRLAIAFGRTWKIMHQSVRRIYGFRVTVYVTLLELRGQNKYDCWPDIICCWDYIALCIMIHALTCDDGFWYREMYRDTWVAIRYAYRRPKYRDTSMYRYGPSGVCSIFWEKALRRCKVQCY